jgi:hypothetical protein
MFASAPIRNDEIAAIPAVACRKSRVSVQLSVSENYRARRPYSNEIPPNFVLTEVVAGVGSADGIVRGALADTGATGLREDNGIHGNDVYLKPRVRQYCFGTRGAKKDEPLTRMW